MVPEALLASFLRQEKRKDRVYLQMYETYWDKEKKQPRSRSVQAFGYVDVLASPAMPDPVQYYKDYVGNENRKRAALLADETRPRAFRVVKKGDGSFINSSQNQELNARVKQLTGPANLDALYLAESELDKMFKNCLLGLA